MRGPTGPSLGGMSPTASLADSHQSEIMKARITALNNDANAWETECQPDVDATCIFVLPIASGSCPSDINGTASLTSAT
jgi:hypothetical protein